MTRHNRARMAPALALLALVVSCGGDDNADDSPTDGGRADAAIVDGAPGDPDAAPGDPDAAPGDPDAAPGDPDAAPGDPDAGPFICDPVAQTGCGDGEKCDLAPTGTFGCVADGDLGEMSRCDPQRPNACAAGFTCRDTNNQDFRCARLCRTDDQCRSGDLCSSVRMTSDGESYRMCATIHECQPFVQDCVDPERVCALTPAGAFCVPPGDKDRLPDGSLCQLPIDCQDGSTCLNLGRGNRCVRLCDPEDSEPACTSAGDACSRFTEVGPQPIGVCN